MKICYICDEINLNSGWAVVNYHTIIEAQKKGYKVTVFTSRKAKNKDIPGAHIYPILYPLKGSLGFQDLFNVFIFLKILNRGNFNFVHTLIEPYLIYNLLVWKKPRFFNIHGTYSVSLFQQSKFKFFYRWALRSIQSVFSNSEYTRYKFFEATHFPRITVTGLGVDFKNFHQVLDLSKKRAQFCLIGHLKERKGGMIAIQALESLLPQYPEAKLIFVGNDSSHYAQTCKAYVIKKKLSHAVQFKGRVSDNELLKVYQESLCNLLPSINTKDGSFEGFGLIHLEANAAGLPTIGSKETGNESAIQPGISGYLANQGDPRDLSLKMEAVLISFKEANYAQFSENCVNFARERSWEKYFSHLNEIYSALD